MMNTGVLSRTIAGFVLAPLTCGATTATWMIVSAHVHDVPVTLTEIRNIAMLGVLAGYVCTAVGGIPLYFALRYLGWTSLWTFLLLGCLLGIFAFELTWPGGIKTYLGLAPNVDFGLRSGLIIMEVMCGVAGTIAAAAFWLIVKPQPASR